MVEYIVIGTITARPLTESTISAVIETTSVLSSYNIEQKKFKR
jgi:hypothetical protein